MHRDIYERRKESEVAAKAGKKKAAAKGKAAAVTKTPPKPRAVPVADKATFGFNDKRAQYARLVVFNFAVKTKKAGKDKDVNTVGDSVLEAAGKELAGGNMLAGDEGLQLIADLSKAGATDEKVAKRGLTRAYAAEVRPFIRRLNFSDSFGRRTPVRAKKEEGKKEEPAKAGS